MKKLIMLMLVLLVVAVPFVIAESTGDKVPPGVGVVDESKLHKGDFEYGRAVEEMSWWAKLMMSFKRGQGLTVVGGASCSRFPDAWEQCPGGDCESYPNWNGQTDQMYCYTNDDHIGVAIQFWEIDNNGGWNFREERQLVQDQTACEWMDAGEVYRMDYYFCDETASRTCTDSDGGIDPYEKGTVTFRLGDEPAETYTDYCESDILLHEGYCDEDNSVVSGGIDCWCDNGACEEDDPEDPEDPEEPGELEMTLDDLEVSPTTVEVGDPFTISGRAHIEGECDDCIIETGLQFYGQALALTSSDGACGDQLTVGVKFDAEDEWVNFELTDIATRSPDQYRVTVIGASGCHQQGGYELDRGTVTLTVVEASGTPDDPGDDPEEPGDDPEDPEDPDDPYQETCYSCEGGQAMEETLTLYPGDSCPLGSVSWMPICTDQTHIYCMNNPDDPSCDDLNYCSENPQAPICLDDFCAENPSHVNCEVPGGWDVTVFEGWFDFKNNTAVAVGLTAFIIVILVLGVYLLVPNKRGGRRR